VTELDMTSLFEHPAWQLGNILDIRPADEFERGHFRRAVSIPVKVPADLEGLLPSIFLPPRQEPLIVVAGEPDAARAVCEFLQGRGRSEVAVLRLGPDDLSGLPPAEIETGPSARHLWRPPEFLARWQELLPPPEAGPVLDLGAGSCRAAVWLAERGYRVTAVDRDPEALALGRRLAASRGLGPGQPGPMKGRCEFAVADLRDPEQVPAGRWAAVLVFRYLERGLLARLAKLLLPGGVAMVRTFRDAPGFAGPPRRRFRLEAGELLRLFPRAKFTVLAHEEGLDPDGRPAAGIVARLGGGG